MDSSHAQKPSHRTLFVELALVITAIPLSMWAALHNTSLNPRASGDIVVTDTAGNTVRLSPHFTGNTLNCRVGQPCSASFDGESNSATDHLNLDVNFLPPPLTQNLCETHNNLKNTTIGCGFSGTPSRAGEFKLLVALENQTGSKAQSVVNLNIH